VKVLGLDISSATIGWALVESLEDGPSLVEYGHIKPPKSNKGSLVYRLSCAYNKVEELFVRFRDVDYIIIEAYANKFTPGRSSARTIMVLSVFNEVVSLSCYRTLDKEPIKYAVASIRSTLSKFFNKKITSKEEAFEAIKDYFKNFTVILNRSGKIKKECYDEADAIAAALTFIYLESN